MSREIKFRAWADYGNGHGEMLPNIQNHINGDWAFGNILMNKVEGTNFVVEQFTGLTDRKGVEVYVGDIVKFGKYTAEILFPENEFQPLFFNDWTEEWSSLAFFKGYEDFEVIGNIHKK